MKPTAKAAVMQPKYRQRVVLDKRKKLIDRAEKKDVQSNLI